MKRGAGIAFIAVSGLLTARSLPAAPPDPLDAGAVAATAAPALPTPEGVSPVPTPSLTQRRDALIAEYQQLAKGVDSAQKRLPILRGKIEQLTELIGDGP